LEVGQRLRLSRPLLDTLEKIISLIKSINSLKPLPTSQFTLTLEKVPIYGVYAIYCITEDQQLKEKISNYASKWRFITPGFNGNTLRERGVPPGPQYGYIISEIRNAWLDGLISSPADEEKMVTQFLHESHD
jgi:hypothetical protein